MKKSVLLFSLLIVLVAPIFGQGIDKPRYQILTTRAGNFLGTFDIELFPLIAPLHVQNFDSLVNDQFFDSTAFHRVVPGFVIQGGDPNTVSGPISTWGQGQPWQVTVPAEFSEVRHLRGILGAARDTDPNSATSQFYICVANSTFLDGNYTVYGQVTNGMNIVDTIVSSPRNANDVPLQKIEMFVTYTGVNDSVPDAPVLNAPADGAIGILNTQNFTWSNVPGAVLYTIEFSTDPAFSTIYFTRNAGINFALATALSGSTTYYWRVKSNNGGHESIYSSTRTFNTATAAANLVFPPDSATGINLNPVFTWDPVTNADSYTLQVSTTSTFTTQSMVYNTAGITTTSQQVGGLNPNQLYYWRVRSASGTTQGFYSVKFSFTTGTTIGLEDHQLQLISLFPNPAHDIITFTALPVDQGNINITLQDKLGRVVYAATEKSSGQQVNHSIPVNHLSSGIYLLSLELNNSLLTTKVAIQ
ncbi:MAG: peptidylprolyl isomerase, partial [Bacteroidota bacterium]|nr:peptidylprolyl isomerase [Bacteroidota bacterium]